MGAAVLRSHDCLKNRLHLDFYDSRPLPMNANTSARKKPSRSPPANQPKATRPRPIPARSVGSGTRKQPAPLVMGQVTILKRGEELKAMIPSPPPPSPPVSVATDLRSDGDDSSDLCSTNRMGPDPQILPKIADLKAVYAGPAFISSPAPSSLPMPAFFFKKSADEASKIATKGLRCLLRLDAIA